MMIIAAGFRQVRPGPGNKKIVKFDQGMYDVPDRASIQKYDGEDCVWCEANADEETGEGYAMIGGVKMPLSYNPFEKNGKKSQSSDED